MAGVDERIMVEPAAAAGSLFGTGLMGELVLIQHTVATGGLLLLGGSPHRLTPIQYELLRILWVQALADSPKPASVRGFVSSYELLHSLPWESCNPEEDHLKQLIRRIRRRFSPFGVAVESCHGLGYRLRLDDFSAVAAVND